MSFHDNEQAEKERASEELMWKWEFSLGDYSKNSLVGFVIVQRLMGLKPIADNQARALVMEWVHNRKTYLQHGQGD